MSARWWHQGGRLPRRADRIALARLTFPMSARWRALARRLRSPRRMPMRPDIGAVGDRLPANVRIGSPSLPWPGEVSR